MAGERGGHVGSRRRNGAFVVAPVIVKRGRLDHKPRCAEAALEGITSNERLLNRMQPTNGDAFDGRYQPVARRLGRHETADHRLAVK